MRTERSLEQRRAYNKQWRLNNQDHIRAVNVALRAQSWLIQAQAFEYKGGARCVDCSYSANLNAIEFDHVRGKKYRNVGEMIAAGRWTQRLVAELDKCDVRCANCHSIQTVVRGQRGQRGH